jgi:capsular polysaccharide transport system ATP-binding protein
MNLRFVARLHGVDTSKFINEVVALAEVEDHVNQRLGQCPRFVKAQLAFVMGLWFDFDIYLFDDKLVGVPKSFVKRAREIVQARTAGKGILLTSKLPAQVLQSCDTIFVLDDGRATYYTDKKAALKHFRALSKDDLPEDVEEDEEEDEDDDEVIM